MKRFNNWFNEVFDTDYRLKPWQSISITFVVVAFLVSAFAYLYINREGEKKMNSLVLVGYYMVKEAVKPRLHHSDFEEYLEDVDLDCFRHTHNFKHMKYIHNLHKLVEEY